MNRYVDHSFSEIHCATIGVDFHIKTIEYNDKVIKLQLWDCAGQERFRSIVSSYYRGSNGIIIAFSVTDRKSFDNVKRWLDECNLNSSENSVKILVGTKIDLDKNRVVLPNEGIELAKELNLEYIEISSKTGKNVELIFSTIIKELMKHHNQLKLPTSNKNTITLQEKNSNKKKKCCAI